MKNIIPLNSQPSLSTYEKIAICLIFMSDAMVMTGDFSGGIPDILVSAVISIPFIIMSDFLIKHEKNSVIMRVFAVIFSFSAIIISLSVFSDFIKTCVLPDINRLLIPAGILIAAFYSAFRTMTTLSRSVHVIMPILIFFAAIGLILVSTRMRTENIKFNISENFSSTVRTVLLFTFVFILKGILLLYLFSFEKSRRTDGFSICTGTLIYGILMSLILFMTLSVLGPGLYKRLEYPVYYPLGLTGFGDYLERTEIISVIMFMVILTFKTGIFIRIILIACGIRKPVH